MSAPLDHVPVYPDPKDRFPYFVPVLIAAAIICGAVMWWVV